MEEEETPTGNGGGRRRKAPEKVVYTWSDLETKKSNAACAMDRVEFLASTRNRFTEFRAQEADKLRFAIRSRKAPSHHMRQTLTSSAESAAAVLTKQDQTLTTAKTGSLRLDALNRFVVEKEKHTGGKAQETMAISYAKKSKPLVKPYPLYDDLYNLELRDPGKPREPPLSAVSCLLSYNPPPKALRHGMSKSQSLSGSLMSTARSRKSDGNEEEADH
mmetsp:Transcript_32931/g.61698  ORF Transcript_32931/g.61698 Transcript_32931/m.61698 type:complete len:218 (-) Transcript_32931:52-705(-)